MKSKIEELILSKDFQYIKPYFYDNPSALRCELGIGDDEVWMKNAKTRAKQIYDILFPHSADALIFNYWMFDHSMQFTPADMSDFGVLEPDKDGFDDGIWEAWKEKSILREMNSLNFLYDMKGKYRYAIVRGLNAFYDPDDYDENVRRDRIVCYPNENGFDDMKYIEDQLADDLDKDMEVSLVSFENECILSVYDDRGCDVVFATHEKMKEFYHKLEPFFLQYDLEEMKKRYDLS